MTRYLIVLLAFSAACDRDSTAPDTGRFPDLELTVAAAETYVEGGPMLLAIDIKSTRDRYRGSTAGDTWFPARLKWRGEPFIVRLSRIGQEREIILEAKPRESIACPRGPEGSEVLLEKGEHCRMLVDLGNLSPWHRIIPVYAVPPGQYDVTVAFTSSDGTLPGRPFRIRVVQPSQGDRVVLERIREVARRRGTTETWVYRIARVDDPDAFKGASPELLSALRPYLFVREALRAKSLADVTTTHLAEMGKTHLAPEAAAWRYELLVARGDEPGAATLRETIQKDCPGLTWRLKEVEEGRSQFPIISSTLRPRRQAATRE